MTSTTTTYTATHSLKKLECTPSGFQMAGKIFHKYIFKIEIGWI